MLVSARRLVRRPLRTTSRVGIPRNGCGDRRALAEDGRALAEDGRALAEDGRALAGDGRALAGDGRAIMGDVSIGLEV
jgi:hypothetical protein